MPDRSELIRLQDGRMVGIHTATTDGAGKTVVFCHGTPGSGALDPDPDVTSQHAITLLGIDRPGYGDSDPLPTDTWQTVALAAQDIAEVLEQVQPGPVGVVGWSAGGWVALALAAIRPDLVERVAVIGTPAPHPNVPWIPGDIWQHLEELRGKPPEVVHEEIGDRLLPYALDAAGSFNPLGLLGIGSGDDDRPDIPGAFGSLAGMFLTAFRQRSAGLVADIAGQTLQPWGFSCADVQAETLLLFGAKDPIADELHARWWLEHLPNARAEILPDAGHLLILNCWDRVLSYLTSSGD